MTLPSGATTLARADVATNHHDFESKPENALKANIPNRGDQLTYANIATRWRDEFDGERPSGRLRGFFQEQTQPGAYKTPLENG